MKFLVWDTSSKLGVLAGFETSSSEGAGRLVAELSLSVDTSSHSERLLWAIDQCLTACGWDLKEVDVFGVGVGPGSFTGLRIGITTARTLAHTLNKPLVGVSSLAALAYPLAHVYANPLLLQETLVIASTDACKGELFALWGTAAEVTAGIYTEVVLTAKVLVDRLTSEYLALPQLVHKSARWVVLGEGRQRYADEWARLPQAGEIKTQGLIQPSFYSTLTGRALAQLVWEGYTRQVDHEPLAVHPNYLRASDAEVRLKARTVLTS